MSQPINFDDPIMRDAWCAQQHKMVKAFMSGQQVRHGLVGSYPAFFLAPLVSVWTIESGSHPGTVGWWVIAGDLPTDYFSAQNIDHPRKVISAAADKWDEMLAKARSGLASKVIIPDLDKKPDLQELLEARISSLRQIAADERLWETKPWSTDPRQRR